MTLRLLSLAGPDGCSLVKDNIAIVLHSGDDRAVTGRPGRVCVPDGFSVLVTAQMSLLASETPQITGQQKHNQDYQAGGGEGGREREGKETYYMHRFPSSCILMPLIS